MSDWQERITRETPPAIQAEHELRYALAAPLIGRAAAWADLGCGNGLAAAAALGDARPASAVLVDLDVLAARRAAATLGLQGSVARAGDLTDARFLDQVGESLLAGEGERVVTCFEVVEHLSSFLPLLSWSTELARTHGVSVILSVPNDAFWAIQNPFHQTAWGEGAFEELQRLLPPQRTLLRQVALTGSMLLGWDAALTRCELTVGAGGPGTVATHFLVAFGPGHTELARSARVVEADPLGQRRWERERESNLTIAEHEVHGQEAAIAEMRQELRANVREFEAWRTYIHELERDLGRPLSGIAKEEEHSSTAGTQRMPPAPDGPSS